MKYERIRELRELNGYSQKKVAEMLGMHTTQYQRYETGERTMPIDFVIQIADLYGVSIDYLVGREEQQSEDCGNVG